MFVDPAQVASSMISYAIAPPSFGEKQIIHRFRFALFLIIVIVIIVAVAVVFFHHGMETIRRFVFLASVDCPMLWV